MNKFLIPITKKEMKIPDENNTHVMNIAMKTKVAYPTLYELTEDFVLHWNRIIGIKYGKDNQTVQNQIISKALGFKPQYYALRGSENYRNAIWGFKCDSFYPFILYNSKKGFQLTCSPQTHPIHIIKVLRILMMR